MIRTLFALTMVLVPGVAVGSELRCERWYDNRLVDAATFRLDDHQLAIQTARLNPVNVDAALIENELDLIAQSLTLSKGGTGGPLVSVATARMTSPSPAGDLEFAPSVYFVDWGAGSATYVYTIGGGALETVTFDSCTRLD